jgi:hypothetical protein
VQTDIVVSSSGYACASSLFIGFYCAYWPSVARLLMTVRDVLEMSSLIQELAKSKDIKDKDIKDKGQAASYCTYGTVRTDTKTFTP